MAIYREDIVDIELTSGTIHRSFLTRSIGSGDNKANRFGVRVLRNGSPVELGLSTVEGFFRNSNGDNIAITDGNIVSGNTAVVILPQACYNYEGQFCLAIKIVGGGITGTMRIVDGVVDNTNTGGAVAPTETVPTYQEILAVYEEMEEAVEIVESLQEELEEKYVGFRRYMTAEDDCFTVDVGVYGISPSANLKPDNLPSDFPETAGGFLVALEKENDRMMVGFIFQNYAKRVWFRSGYDWEELAKVSAMNSAIASAVDNVYSYLYNNLIPDFVAIAKDSYVPGSALSATKTQYKFLDSTGVRDVAETYMNWYVTNAITVSPFTFYYVDGSAQYNGHHIYQVLDSNGNIIAYEEATSSTVLTLSKKLIYTPEGAASIRIASVNGASGAAVYNATEKSISQKWVGEKWVCIGDSLTDTNIRTTMHYHDYIAQKTGITVVNLGKGGTGYKRSYDGNGPFIDRVSSIPTDASVVTIFGSGNDAIYTIGDPSDTGDSTLCGAINTTITAIFNRITTCRLGIITPTPWQSYNPADDTNWMARYSEAIVAICKRWGIPCLDLYHCSNLRPWDATFRAAAYSKDDGNGVHPDETGHAIITPMIESFVESLLMH